MTEIGSLAHVRLEGGPRDLPEGLRSATVPDGQHVIKLEHRGGYEHFHRTGETYDEEHGRAVLFRWVWRTRIAE